MKLPISIYQIKKDLERGRGGKYDWDQKVQGREEKNKEGRREEGKQEGGHDS